jgi:hypothetical protein
MVWKVSSHGYVGRQDHGWGYAFRPDDVLLSLVDSHVPILLALLVANPPSKGSLPAFIATVAFIKRVRHNGRACSQTLACPIAHPTDRTGGGSQLAASIYRRFMALYGSLVQNAMMALEQTSVVGQIQLACSVARMGETWPIHIPRPRKRFRYDMAADAPGAE